MKIAYLSRGNSVWDRRLLEKMVERGHKPYFISYYPGERVRVEGVENYHYDYTSMHYFPKFLSLQTALHLRKLLKSIRPDVLHTGWVIDMGFFGALCGFKPVLSMPYGSDVLLKPYESKSLKWIVRFTLRRADMIYCDCEMVKKRITELSGCSPEKIVVFPCGIDLNVFRPLNGPSMIRKMLGWENKKVLICTRNFDIRVHGVEYFIQAIPAILEGCPDVRVLLVGSGPLEQEYRKLVSGLNLEDIVHFTGWLNEIQMAEHLNAADVYVSTSLSDGTSVSMLEAMACGLPMVVTDVPSYFEWIKDGVNGYIVARKDVSRLAEKIINLLKNPELRKKMSECNLEIVSERADWERNFDILEGIYKTLVL